MAAKMQLNALMASMFATGLLDGQFKQLHMLQDASGQNFIIELITLFCKEGGRIIGELSKVLDKPCVDFTEVGALLFKLSGGSASIGARRVKNTCIQFHKFCKEKNRYGCLKTLDVVRKDFYDLRIKFQTMVQLEHQVRTFYPRQ